MSHHERVEPVVVRAWRPELAVDARRVVGYRRVCSCGGRTGRHATVALARAAELEHVEEAGGAGG